MSRTKKMFSVTSLIIAFTMLFSFSSVFASEPSEDYVVTYSAEEIKDTDVLMEMALAQAKTNGKSSSANAEENLSVTQLLEVREYADGHQEKEYSKTALLVVDNETLKPVSSRSYVDNSQGDNGYGYGVAAHIAIYYSAYSTGSNIFDLQNWVRINKSTGTITSNAPSVYGFTHGYHIYAPPNLYDDMGRIERVGSPSNNVTYTVNSNNSTFYLKAPANSYYASAAIDTIQGAFYLQAYI